MFEFLSAIPGSVGGALAMNAGAFGFEIWSLVESVTTINTLGVFNEFCGKIIGWLFKDTAAIRLTNRLRIVTLF
jgi:UDP-N-acetylenolpyruvoylglucosamine reductase